MTRSAPLAALLSASLLFVGACSEPQAPAAADAEKAAALDSAQQRMGYSLGASVGRQFRDDGLQVDVDALAQGVRDGFAAETLRLSDEQVAESMQQLQREHSERMQAQQNELATKNRADSEAFLARNATEADVVRTESGLQYKVLSAGEGPKPTADDTVTVHYRGTLIDGREFDSSYKRGEPATFPVSGVIPGWIEALQLMPVGSKWMLYIPADLAYGPGGAGGLIGPNSALIFEVELLSIADQTADGG
jgi:FKBP-type peptidyl-prolyl cis-trans isomerase